MENELSVRLKNSLKQFNLTLEEAIATEYRTLKQIGFGNRSLNELKALAKPHTNKCHDCGGLLESCACLDDTINF